MSDIPLLGDRLRQPPLLQGREPSGALRPQERAGVERPAALGGDGPARTDAAEPGGFVASLGDALRAVDSLQDDARGKAAALARGEPVEVHDLMIAMGKSEVAFNLMLEIRNKLVDAWQTLSRSTM